MIIPMKKIKGILPPMVTPLLDNGTIDYEGARRIADRMMDAGVSAIFLLGTAFVIYKGVNKGIEAISKILMPVLLLAVIGIAAAIILAFLLWPESHEAPIKQPEPHSVVAMHTAKQDTLVMQIEKAHTPMIAKETTLQTQTVTTKQANQVQAHQEMEEATKVGRTDSFDYYLAQLEAEMDALDDSVSSAQLEKLISADARLRQLVNRIVGNEVEQALNATKPDSTTDYLNF